MTFYEKLRLFPPILIRLLARNRSELKSDQAISSDANLWEVQIRTLQLQTSWGGIDVPTSERFLIGCGANLESREWMNRTATYFRGDPSFLYLRKDKDWQPRWMPMLIAWRSIYPERIGKDPEWKPMRRIIDRTSPLLILDRL